jgi:hypothetical protein
VRVLYRARQFWHSIFIKTDLNGIEQARDRLTPAQWALFSQLQPDEQAHAFRIFHKLLEQGETQDDLLVAALLHDVGKLRYQLKPLERMMIVVAQAFLPKHVKRWGSLPPGGWDGIPGLRKAFILAENHAEWGAELAQHAGASALAVALIRNHQHPQHSEAGEIESSLLNKLRLIDNDS